jgi:hypothetical protein
MTEFEHILEHCLKRAEAELNEEMAAGYTWTDGNTYYTTSNALFMLGYLVTQAQTTGFDQTITLVDLTDVTLTSAQVIQLQLDMVTYGRGLYNSWLTLKNRMLTASVDDLTEYFETGILPEA